MSSYDVRVDYDNHMHDLLDELGPEVRTRRGVAWGYARAGGADGAGGAGTLLPRRSHGATPPSYRHGDFATPPPSPAGVHRVVHHHRHGRPRHLRWNHLLLLQLHMRRRRRSDRCDAAVAVAAAAVNITAAATATATAAATAAAAAMLTRRTRLPRSRLDPSYLPGTRCPVLRVRCGAGHGALAYVWACGTRLSCGSPDGEPSRLVARNPRRPYNIATPLGWLSLSVFLRSSRPLLFSSSPPRSSSCGHVPSASCNRT